jgi:hypothetical protein
MSDESVPTTQPTLLSDESIPPLPYDIYLSEDPFDDQLNVDITLKGDHSTLGMIFQFCKFRNRLQLINMAKSTPGARLHKWRSTLRHAYLLKIDNQDITCIDDLKIAINNKRLQGKLKITCCFAMDRSFGIHPHHGIPQLYFDQLNVIAKHLQDIKHKENSIIRSLQLSGNTPTDTDTVEQMTTDTPEGGQFFTKKEIQKRPIGRNGKTAYIKC